MQLRLLELCVISVVFFTLAGCGRHREITVKPTPAALTSALTPLSASASRGRAIYAAQCAVCHANDGSGLQMGTSLRGIGKRRTFAQIRAAIDDPTPPMPKLAPAQISEQDVADVAAYVEQL